MDDSNEKTVLLNQDIGYLLMKHLNGLNVINFMEAVNGSEQFSTVEITEEQIFLALFKKFMPKEKVKVVVSYLHCYLDTCSVDDEGYLCPNRYYQGAPPLLRLFVHPSFTVEAFEHLCWTYKTPSFQCYSRLLPLNTYTYVGNLVLIDYFKYKDIIGCMREFNEHEQSLFKECSFFRSSKQSGLNKQLSFVTSTAEFMINFERRFKSALWVEAIDFGKFHIADGCIVNSLCKEPFPATVSQLIDINFHGSSYSDFDDAVTKVFVNLTATLSQDGHQSSATLTKKGSCVYNAILPFDVKLRFNYKDIPDDINPLSYALHGSDIDVTQVAFTDTRIVCTIAFLQAMATKSFLCYTLHGDMDKSITERISRYRQRGFVFLEPEEFDDALYADLMSSTVLGEMREETREIMNEDGEIQIVMITYQPRQLPFPNVDPHRLQETFINRICSQKLG